jgi:hypothetical protein
VKINPAYTSGIDLDQNENQTIEYLAPAYLNYTVAIQAIN